MTELEGEGLSWNHVFRITKNRGKFPWNMEIVKVRSLSWEEVGIPVFNPGFYLHALVDAGYFQLLMTRLGVPSDLPAVS